MKPVVESKLRELLDFAHRHGLAEVAWQDKDLRISFRRGVQKSPAAPVLETNGHNVTVVPEEELVIRSPMVGTFRRSTSKDRPPLVMEGNHIKPGDRLGIVECMKIPNDVVSYGVGEIKKIIVEDGQPVEYGQPLFLVKLHETSTANGKS